MHLSVYYHQHRFRFPFRIAHTVREFTECLYICVSDEKFIGIGESVFPPYVDETIEESISFFEKLSLSNISTLECLNDFIDGLLQEYPEHVFAIAGLDNALHDFLRKRDSKEISDIYDIEKSNVCSSFTIGISSKEEMLKKLNTFPNEKYYKLKVDQNNIERVVMDFLSLSNRPFVIDANQGFTERKQALLWCDKLFKMGVKYLEQPFGKSNYEDHCWLKENTEMPIIADESFQTIDDFENVQGGFDGVNVKLMKIGGVNNAFKALVKAKELGLKTVLGCMSESSIGINAASQIAPLADWVDLDGAKLIVNDPFSASNLNAINKLKRVV